MSREDEMVSALIESAKNDNTQEVEVEVEPEAHYNYYGDRGVADLFVWEVEELDDGRKYTNAHVYEVKSGEAVREATGANEILRQFHRMRRYFFKDDSRRMPNYARFELCFVPSETTVKHVAENIDLYRASQQKELSSVDSFVREGHVLFRTTDPGETVPAHISGSGFDMGDDDSWQAALSATNPGEPATRRVLSILENLGYGGESQ